MRRLWKVSFRGITGRSTPSRNLVFAWVSQRQVICDHLFVLFLFRWIDLLIVDVVDPDGGSYAQSPFVRIVLNSHAIQIFIPNFSSLRVPCWRKTVASPRSMLSHFFGDHRKVVWHVKTQRIHFKAILMDSVISTRTLPLEGPTRSNIRTDRILFRIISQVLTITVPSFYGSKGPIVIQTDLLKINWNNVSSAHGFVQR